MEAEIIYVYEAAANTAADGTPIASLPGVPLRDLTAADVAAQPEHIRAGLATSPLYRFVGRGADDAAEEG